MSPDSSTCWLWTKSLTKAGYGRLWDPITKRLVYAHRRAYEVVHGPAPDGTEIDHLCRNRACYNPDHLEAVTHATNMQRGGPASRTHCLHGHEYTPENTKYYATSKSAYRARFCRTCEQNRNRSRYTRTPSAE